MNAEFSIVIPYYAISETIDLVKRQLNYYHLSSIPMDIILAVAGDESIKAELKSFINELNDPRFNVITNSDSSITNYECLVKRIYSALQLVKTPYVVINGADDVVIPEVIVEGCLILKNNTDISATKGYTIAHYSETGENLICNDCEIIDNLPIDRIKNVMRDYDSIFYIIRRTEDLRTEYKNIIELAKKFKILWDSPYHIEHFIALSVASLGKIYVFKTPWRIFNVHEHNHSSHTPAAFLRVKFGTLDKDTFEWFKSITKNMECLSYSHYKFLWVCHQIRGISVSLKQILYIFLYKERSFTETVRILIYFVLNKLFLLIKKAKLTRNAFCNDQEDFFESEQYKMLKKYYFSDKNL